VRKFPQPHILLRGAIAQFTGFLSTLATLIAGAVWYFDWAEETFGIAVSAVLLENRRNDMQRIG
jgi:hypothetical protein